VFGEREGWRVAVNTGCANTITWRKGVEDVCAMVRDMGGFLRELVGGKGRNQ
jgi:hypothetical protein